MPGLMSTLQARADRGHTPRSCGSQACLALALLLALLLPCMALSQARDPSVTPLLNSEVEAAAALSLSNLGLAHTDRAPAGTFEILLVERAPSNKLESPERRALTLIYDYSRDVLIRLEIAIDSQRVLERSEMQGAQPPLTPGERAKALAVVFKDGPTRRLIRRQFREITGQALENSNRLEVKAFVFLASAHPGVKGTGGCGIERCAQLLIATPDQTALDLSPIVNLSRGELAATLRVDATHTHDHAGAPVH